MERYFIWTSVAHGCYGATMHVAANYRYPYQQIADGLLVPQSLAWVDVDEPKKLKALIIAAAALGIHVCRCDEA